jgi:hypothetical protein
MTVDPLTVSPRFTGQLEILPGTSKIGGFLNVVCDFASVVPCLTTSVPLLCENGLYRNIAMGSTGLSLHLAVITTNSQKIYGGKP